MTYSPARRVFVRSALNYDTDAASAASGVSFSLPSKAQQQFKDECDINSILRRFGVTGQVPVSSRVPSYGDFSEIFDFHTAMNAVTSAQADFMKLPALVRKRFANDPQALLEFVSDASNRDEAVKLGLVPAPVEPVASPSST